MAGHRYSPPSPPSGNRSHRARPRTARAPRAPPGTASPSPCGADRAQRSAPERSRRRLCCEAASLSIPQERTQRTRRSQSTAEAGNIRLPLRSPATSASSAYVLRLLERMNIRLGGCVGLAGGTEVEHVVERTSPLAIGLPDGLDAHPHVHIRG